MQTFVGTVSEDWLRTLHARLVRELLAVIEQSNEEREELPEDLQCNVATIEAPVEYEIDGINHIQVDLRHGLDFTAGVKAMLRLDPDYLMRGNL